MAFRPGDVVVLKSGGPRMTVVSEISNNVRCQWFTRAGVLKTALFRDKLLREVGAIPLKGAQKRMRAVRADGPFVMKRIGD